MRGRSRAGSWWSPRQYADRVRCLMEKETVMNLVKAFLREEEGATATEYAVMLALIIVVALGAITALGTKVSSTFADIEGSL